MKLKIKDIQKFKNMVFGADLLILYFPELLSTDGVDVILENGNYYINKNFRINDTAFISTAEAEYCCELVNS